MLIIIVFGYGFNTAFSCCFRQIFTILSESMSRLWPLTWEFMLFSNVGGNDFSSSFDSSSPLCFLIEFHCTQTSNILCLLSFNFHQVVSDSPPGLHSFSCSLYFSLYSPLSLTLSTCFIVLAVPIRFCCSHARVFGKILVHEFPISYSHTEWNLLSSLSFDRLCFGWGVLLN